jgi:catechol 2,3-dioxygenase-like lactoylglutathione lyase family enzyme
MWRENAKGCRQLTIVLSGQFRRTACISHQLDFHTPAAENRAQPVSKCSQTKWQHYMTAQLNHTIVWCRDKQRSAAFLTQILGRPAPTSFGPFLIVELDNGVSLDFHEMENNAFTPQHYAFLITEEDFDAVFARIGALGATYWADPGKRHRNQINRNDGGRGFYFEDPDGHMLEVITRPYGSGE